MSNDNFESVLTLLNLSRDAPGVFKNSEIEEKRMMINYGTFEFGAR
jgi:hypothetical protein